MTIEFTGKVHEILPLKTGVGRNGPWSRGTVVFEVPDGRYMTKIACENANDAEKFVKLKKGQSVHVKADISSREYNGNWYTSAVCWEFKPESDDMPI